MIVEVPQVATQNMEGLGVRIFSADRFQLSGEIEAGLAARAGALLAMLDGRVVGRIRPPVSEAASAPFHIPIDSGVAPKDGERLTLALEREDGVVVLAKAPVRTRVAGALDRCNAALVRGWAANLNCPDLPLEVDIFLNGQHQGCAVANRRRSDLERMEKRLSATGFLFKFSRPLDLSAAPSFTVTARVRNTGLTLANGPWWIKRSYSEVPLLSVA